MNENKAVHQAPQFKIAITSGTFNSQIQSSNPDSQISNLKFQIQDQQSQLTNEAISLIVFVGRGFSRDVQWPKKQGL
jgi:hypothetical protein